MGRWIWRDTYLQQHRSRQSCSVDKNHDPHKLCHVAVLRAAGVFCFPSSVPFSGVSVEESCRVRKGDGTVAFPHEAWDLTFLLPNVPEAFFFLFISCVTLHQTFSVVHQYLAYYVWRIPTHLPRHQLIQKLADKHFQRPYFCLFSWVTCWFFEGLIFTHVVLVWF